MNIAYLNGSFLPQNEVCISPDDRGFLFADGIYEVMRWYGSFFLGMDLHIQRLRNSLFQTKIHWDNTAALGQIAKELVFRNKLDKESALVYLQVTRGVAPRMHRFPDMPIQPTVYAFASPFINHPEQKTEGVKVCTTVDFRWSRCNIKSIALLPNVLAFQDAWEKNCHECLFIRNGYYTEASHANVFFVRQKKVFTHPESGFILPGVTRRIVIDLCRRLEISIEELPVPADETDYMDEVFLTGTSAEVTPVIAINGQPVRDGHPGVVTRKLQAALDEYIQQNKLV